METDTAIATGKDEAVDRRSAAIMSTVLFTVLAVALAIFYVVYGPAKGPDALSSSDQKLVMSVAGQAAVDVNSYNYKTIKTQFANVSKELTGTILADFTKEEAAIDSSFTNGKAVSQAQVLDVGVKPTTAGPNQATVLVALEVDYMPAGSTPTPETELLELELTRSANSWLVSNITTVA